MLEVRGLRKRIGENEILKGIDISIDKGDVVAVLGPSGSGKTSLLRCMNYLERADEGRMLIDDREYDMKSISKKEIAEYRRITSVVFIDDRAVKVTCDQPDHTSAFTFSFGRITWEAGEVPTIRMILSRRASMS